MTKDELERIILKGEGLTVEFKLCKNGLTNSVFETVSSFSNRYGGHIYPKNPILANFFINIGRADSLGSGIKNLYKFSKIYSGKEPILVEDDIFRTFIPIILSDKKYTEMVLAYVDKNDEISVAIAAKIIDRSQTTARRILKKLVCEKILNIVGGNKNRKYVNDKKNKEKILAYIDKNGEINAAIAIRITGRSQATARRILKKLVCENILNAVGGNKNRKYMRKQEK